jgi:8-oxo-dGTP pyrophosphatase MutT (NUDIX family)
MTRKLLQPWKVQATRYVHRDRWISLRADDCVTADGVEIAPYYVVERGDTVHIVAIDADDNVILTRQYRHGIGAVSLELPSGRMEDHERDPVQTAARELLEETGYAAAQMTLLASLSSDAANRSGLAHFILAEKVSQIQRPQPDPTEVIEVQPTSYRHAIDLALSGAIVQALHVSALIIALRSAGKLNL